MHLLLVIHGMAGCVEHVAEIVSHFSDKHPAVEVLVAESNQNDKTYDGIDYGAQRVLKELDARIATLETQNKRVSHFSVVGYSLGGLIARYLIGLLFQRGFFDSIVPLNFSTFTTPHLGEAPFPFTPYIWYWLGSTFLGRTGKQLYCLDTWSNTEKPLLEVMVDKDFIFYQALAKFANFNVYANGINDLTVPYYTAAFEESDPFAGHSDGNIFPNFVPGYEPVLASYTFGESPSSWKRPLTFDGPIFEWVYPWNLVLYLFVPPFILGFLFYLPFRYVFLTYTSRSRRSKMAKKLDLPTQSLIEALPPLLFKMTAPKIVWPDKTAGTLMSDGQKHLVQLLNELPNVQKYTIFRPWVRNAHAMMICLDSRFKNHRQGRGVLRHWVDNFEVV